MTHEELMKMIDDKINEIFFEYQVSSCIDCGDIDLANTIRLDNIKKALAKVVTGSMALNYPAYDPVEA